MGLGRRRTFSSEMACTTAVVASTLVAGIEVRVIPIDRSRLVDPLPIAPTLLIVLLWPLLRYLQLIAVRGTSAMRLAEGDSLLSYLAVGLEPIEVLHDLIAHPFWEDIHQECPDQFGTELLMVIRFERAQHLLPLDDPSLDIFPFLS